MWLRANIVLVIAVLFALVQMFASATGGPRLGAPASTVMSTIAHNLPGTSGIAQADNGDEDNSDDNDNGDVDNSDNSDNSDEDNSDDDNGNDNSDNSSDEDNSDNGDDDNSDNGDSGDADVVIDNVAPPDAGGAATATPTTSTTSATTAAPAANAATTAGAPSVAAAPAATAASTAPSSSSVANAASALPAGSASASPSPAAQAATQVSATTSGVDTPLSLNNGRITVQLFSTLPSGLTVTLKMVDPLAYPTTPGIRAGDLIFQIDAKDATGAAVTTLPSEVNVTVHYNDPDVVGLTEANITMGHLDAAGTQWSAVPKLVTDPTGNTVSASITDLGVFAVYVP
jgi:hypothetical protein